MVSVLRGYLKVLAGATNLILWRYYWIAEFQILNFELSSKRGKRYSDLWEYWRGCCSLAPLQRPHSSHCRHAACWGISAEKDPRNCSQGKRTAFPRLCPSPGACNTANNVELCYCEANKKPTFYIVFMDTKLKTLIVTFIKDTTIHTELRKASL